MDISQIPIKISQTGISGNGKQKPPSPQDGFQEFSNQVFAIMDLLSKTDVGKPSISSDGLKKAGSTPLNQKKIDSEDSLQLSSLLAALGAVINQVQMSPAATSELARQLTQGAIPTTASPQTPLPAQGAVAMAATTAATMQSLGLSVLMPSSSATSQAQQSLMTVPNDASTIGNTLSVGAGAQPAFGTIPSPPGQQQDTGTAALLSQLKEKLEGIIQNPSLQQDPMLQNLVKLLGDVQSGKAGVNGQAMLLDSEIQRLFNGSDNANSLKGMGHPVAAGSPATNIGGNLASAAISRPSLDKNLAGITAALPQSAGGHDQNNSIKNSAPEQALDQLSGEGVTAAGAQTVQAADGSSATVDLPTPGTMGITDFVPEMSTWMNRFMKVTNGQSGETEAKFSLYPEHLGPIEVKIISHQGQLSAEILTGTQSAKDALAGQLPQLREALQQQGLQVQKLDIVQQGAGADSSTPFFSQGGFSSPQGQKQFQQARGGSKKQDGNDPYEVESVTAAIPYSGTAPNLSSRIDFTA